MHLEGELGEGKEKGESTRFERLREARERAYGLVESLCPSLYESNEFTQPSKVRGREARDETLSLFRSFNPNKAMAAQSGIVPTTQLSNEWSTFLSDSSRSLFKVCSSPPPLRHSILHPLPSLTPLLR